MAMLDEEGELLKCDRCRCQMTYDESSHELQGDLWFRTIFFSLNRPKEIQGDFCRPCFAAMTPLVYRLRDICELRKFVNKLEKAIREKRT